MIPFVVRVPYVCVHTEYTENVIVPGASVRVVQRFQCLGGSSRRPRVDEDVKRDLVLLTSHAVEGGTHFHVKQM